MIFSSIALHVIGSHCLGTFLSRREASDGRKEGPIQHLCRTKARKLPPKERGDESTEAWRGVVCEDSTAGKDAGRDDSSQEESRPEWPVPRVACQGGWLPFLKLLVVSPL